MRSTIGALKGSKQAAKLLKDIFQYYYTLDIDNVSLGASGAHDYDYDISNHVILTYLGRDNYRSCTLGKSIREL